MSAIQTTRFLQPNQAQQRPPTPFEDLLGDALERAFSSGITELAPLVAYLNQSGPLGPKGPLWFRYATKGASSVMPEEKARSSASPNKSSKGVGGRCWAWFGCK